MAKQGMKRFERQHVHEKNEMSPVPEIQGKDKHGHEKAKTHCGRYRRCRIEGLA